MRLVTLVNWGGSYEDWWSENTLILNFNRFKLFWENQNGGLSLPPFFHESVIVAIQQVRR